MITVRAHYDGAQIVLDEPCQLEPNTELLVTIMAKEANQNRNEEREEWASLGIKTLANGYGEDEPTYSLAMLKEANPNYERR